MGSYLLMGTEFRFCKTEKFRDVWWWLHNNENTLMPLN